MAVQATVVLLRDATTSVADGAALQRSLAAPRQAGEQLRAALAGLMAGDSQLQQRRPQSHLQEDGPRLVRASRLLVLRQLLLLHPESTSGLPLLLLGRLWMMGGSRHIELTIPICYA